MSVLLADTYRHYGETATAVRRSTALFLLLDGRPSRTFIHQSQHVKRSFDGSMTSQN